MSNYLEEIKKERSRQDKKWGQQDHKDEKWQGILGEEFGEVCKAVNEDNPTGERLASHAALQAELREELIQTAAVCVAWLECMDRRNQEGKD